MGGSKNLKQNEDIQLIKQYRSVFIILTDDSRESICFPNLEIFLREYN